MRKSGLGMLLGGLFASLSMIGCSSGDQGAVDPALREEGRAVFGTGGQRDDRGEARNLEELDTGWAVLLEFVGGADHEVNAKRRRALWAKELGRGDVSVRARNTGSAVVLGSYPSPEDSRAQRDLAMIKGMVVNGQRPFISAYLMPPVAVPPEMGERPEWNLLTVRKTPGGRNALYSLHIGVFEGRNRKREAEAATARLRRTGEQAYYFHGPQRSAVTIGLFGEDAYGTRGVSRDVRELQTRFPFILNNGAEPVKTSDNRNESSILVQIPD